MKIKHKIDLSIKKIKSQWVNPEIRDFFMAFKKYSFSRKVHPEEQVLVFRVDGSGTHGGFCDRLKGIISLFHFSTIQGIKFKLLYTDPFNLTDFMVPNEYNWTIDKNLVSRNIFEVKFMNLIADPTIRRLRKINTIKQIHCYGNRDITDQLNKTYNTEYEWKELFNILFKPTQEMSELITFHKNEIGDKYICAVYRFQQLLGDFKEYNFPELDVDEKEILIVRNLQSIHELIIENPKRKILVTSDSLTFLTRASEIEGVYVIPGRLVHIDCTSEEQNDVYQKTFLDFFLLSEGEKIYSIGTAQMFKSEFPLYAAKLKNIPFERILLK